MGDAGGVRFEHLRDDIALSSSFAGIEGHGAIRFIEGVYDGYESLGVWVYGGGTQSISELGVRISYGAALSVNHYRQGVQDYWRGLSGGQSINSYTPSVWSNYRQAVGERVDIARSLWNAGGLGYAAAPFELLGSPFTAGSDILQSYYRGRHGWVAPADRQTTDVASFAVGGTASLTRGGAVRFAGASDSVDLALKFKRGWSASQQADAAVKAQILNDADTIVLKIPRGGTSASVRYSRAGGEVPAGNDVDHLIDLQLGGSDTVGNMWPLDSSVNRSLGVQIHHQIKNLPSGTRINRVTIGQR